MVNYRTSGPLSTAGAAAVAHHGERLFRAVDAGHRGGEGHRQDRSHASWLERGCFAPAFSVRERAYSSECRTHHI